MERRGSRAATCSCGCGRKPHEHLGNTTHLLLVTGAGAQTIGLACLCWYVGFSHVSVAFRLLKSDTLSDVCGFFFRDPPSYSPPAQIEEFLRSGPTPVYIGFGSIVLDDPPKMTNLILEGVQKAGVRAIVSRGWSKLGDGVERPDVLFIGDCPHGR